VTDQLDAQGFFLEGKPQKGKLDIVAKKLPKKLPRKLPKIPVERELAFLRAQNRWLWYHYEKIEDETDAIHRVQYDKRGRVISESWSTVPAKKHRPKYPKKPKGYVHR